jgi:L-seryl-tRNA(Ser) seleniumtransferase
MGAYQALGLEPLINARGTVTAVGGSTLRPDVAAAVAEGSQEYVPVDALLARVGERIAALTGAEAACITAGAAAGLAISAAACIAGEDPERIRRLPEVGGDRSEILVLKSHRCAYDQAIRLSGATIVDVGDSDHTVSENLQSRITRRTAAIFYFAQAEALPGSLPLAEVATIARRSSIPLVVDAAAELPPVDHFTAYLDEGADLALFSGGKDLRGPQATGLILGTAPLVRACAANNFPNYSVGRPMKVDKGAAVGLLRAVEAYTRQDFKARASGWEAVVWSIIHELDPIPGVEVWRDFPLAPGVQPVTIPRAFVGIDVEVTRLTVEELAAELETGDPPIVTDLFEEGLVLNPQLLEPGEEKILIGRLKDILGGNKGRR